VKLLRWEVEGPYDVAFSTRQGGVSEGPFASLNLALRTGDRPDAVEENRRRLCAEIGADPADLSLNRQKHTTLVHRAHRGRKGEPGDGLWTDEPQLPILAMGADCLTIAISRVNGDRPGLAVLHAGWRGLLEGIVPEAVAALGGMRVAAAIGPGIGPCCYEVQDDVAEPFRRVFGRPLVRGRKLDLWAAAERALRAAGASPVHRFDLCTACNPDLFFSERRTGRPRGTQGVVAVIG
jgi:purine-nucleoside/S-methyl-5'-thioadenosine phosphorylase / adenosine deaminase